jgi:hypothetical protein
MLTPMAAVALALPSLVELLLGLPDLDKLKELLKRIQEILAMGGIALALLASFVFLLAWVFSHLRRPSSSGAEHPVLATLALVVAYLPVALTFVAALGWLVPGLAPLTLKSFALAVVLAAFAWCLAVAAIVVGGSRQNLSRARRALLLAGTPWYCLAVYLSTFL